MGAHNTGRWTITTAAALLVALAIPSPAILSGQRASRPANEWTAVLDAPERVTGLRVPDVVAALDLKPGDAVADLGAGTGPFVVALARAVGTTGRVYAVEIDRDFFPHIDRKATEGGVANVQTVLGEAADPRLPGTIDLAFLHDVLHHIANPAAYFQGLAKYLKPGARIAIVDYHAARSPHANDPSLQVPREQAAAWLAAIGFKPVKEVPLFEEKYFVVYGR